MIYKDKNTKYIFYGLAGLAIYKILNEEKKDLWCVKTKNGYELKGDGWSKLYKSGEYEEKDTVSKLLDKCEWLSLFNERTVKWRRFLITAVIICIAVSVFIFEQELSINKYLIMILLIYIILFSLSNYYRFHFERYPEIYSRDNITQIRNKLKLKKTMKELSNTLDNKN